MLRGVERRVARGVPLSELLEEDAVGEALSADPDSLQDSVASQLLQDQLGLQLPSLGHRNVTCYMT